MSGPDDWFAMTSRLRVVLEDPRQLLSGAVTDYAAQQLVDHDNDPLKVTVPGPRRRALPLIRSGIPRPIRHTSSGPPQLKENHHESDDRSMRRVLTRAAPWPPAAIVPSSGSRRAAGCPQRTTSTNDRGSSDEPIVIGMSLPLSGPVADRAKPGMEGYQYWVDELNANGGLLGRQVELKVLDDGFDQQTAISDYTG